MRLSEARQRCEGLRAEAAAAHLWSRRNIRAAVSAVRSAAPTAQMLDLAFWPLFGKRVPFLRGNSGGGVPFSISRGDGSGEAGPSDQGICAGYSRVDGWDVHVRRRRGVSVGGTQPSIGISLGKAPAGTESGVRWLAGLRRVSCCCRPADDHEKKGFLFRHPAKMDCCAIRRIAILRPCLVWEKFWISLL